MGFKPRFSAAATFSTKSLSCNRRRPHSYKPRLIRRKRTPAALVYPVSAASASVSGKMEALKNLIPSDNHERINPEQLFQETADYIVHLEAQVLLLQKLIAFYGSEPQDT